ncbi:MAG: WXG100 family type VII secretion target [Jatrophihabitantaceae bacterium]
MTAFAIQLESLADVVDRMARFERDVEQWLGALDSRVSRLHGTWCGAAADEHRAAHERWMSGAREMREAVATLRRIGSTAHSNYTAAITANQRMWA